MKTIEEIRRDNLSILIAEAGSVQACADRLDRSSAQVSQWKNMSRRSTGKPSVIESDSARFIEAKFNRPTGWMDHDQREWPLSSALLEALTQLDDEAKRRAENSLRGLLDMPALPADSSSKHAAAA